MCTCARPYGRVGRCVFGGRGVTGLVSFDCHPGSPLFSHRRHTLLLLVSVFSFRHHLLFLCRRPLLFRQQHCSLSLLRRTLARSACLDVLVGLSRSPPPATRALRIVLNFSPQNQQANLRRECLSILSKI
jgi:hypothetical protein